MDNSLAAQAKSEHEALQHVSHAINRLIEWRFEGGDASVQLATLRTTAQAFQQHLKRLIEVEEQGGYLEDVVDAKPQLSAEVDTLHQELEEFHALLERILIRLRQVSPTNRARLEVVTDELFALSQKLNEHDRKESDLLQEAFLRDVGGEG